MNLADTEQKSGSKSVVFNTTDTRLTGPWLIIVRAVWLVLVIPSVGLFIASLLVSYQQLQRACVDSVTCNLSGALPVQVLQELPTIGLSVSGFAALVTIFYAINAAIWYGIGFLIFWRRSDDWLALLAAFFLVMFNVTSSGNTASALAGASRYLWGHYLFANLPLQTRVHPCPAPTDEVDYLRGSGGNRSCHNRLSHRSPHPTECCIK